MRPPASAAGRAALASIGLWAAFPVLVVGLVGSEVLRAGARSYVAGWALLVAWFVLARTKTLRWSTVVRLFVAGIPLALLTAFATQVLAGWVDLAVTDSGVAIGIAGTVEELAKLAPLGVLCVVAPARVRRFALVDWLLVGVASGLAFQAAEDAVRRISWSVTAGADLGVLRGGEPWSDPLSGFPHYRWSLLSGSADVGGHAVFPGHHVLTGLIAVAIGLAVGAGGSTRRRAAMWALPVGATLVSVAAHMGFAATVANRLLFSAGDSEVPRPLYLVWKLSDRGRLVGPLLLVAFVAAMMLDAARLRRVDDRLPPHPGGPLPWVPERWNRLGRVLRLEGAGATGPGPSLFGLTADVSSTIGRDLVAVGRGLRRPAGTPQPDRWAATVEVARRRRELARSDVDAAPVQPFRWVALGVAAAATVVLVGSGLQVASGVGQFLAGPGSPSLAGLLDGFSVWWASLGVLSKVAAICGTVALVSFSAGDFGLARPALRDGAGSPLAVVAALSPHRAARSAVELALASVLPARAAAGDLDGVDQLLQDPARFEQSYRLRPRHQVGDGGVTRLRARQHEAARLLASQGVAVDPRPAVSRDGMPGPDLLVNGHRFDFLAPRTADVRQLATVLEIRAVRGGTTRFVLDLGGNPTDLQALRRQLDRFPVPGLEEVVVVRDGRALRFFP